jgi:LacI family transcriptional regulator
VSNDQMQATRLAFQRLRGLGYRRIGLAIGVTDEVGTGELPLAGYLLEQRSLRAPERVPPLHFPAGATDADVCAALGPWIRDERVDAVISTWTTIRRLLRTIGLRCPEEVACACACLSQRRPGQAGVIANLELVGREAVTRLAGLLRAEQYGVPEFPTSTYVEGIWSDGASAPPRRRA